jgi:hypothetical protein
MCGLVQQRNLSNDAVVVGNVQRAFQGRFWGLYLRPTTFIVIHSNIGSKQKICTKLSIAILQTNPKTSGELHAVAVPNTVVVACEKQGTLKYTLKNYTRDIVSSDAGAWSSPCSVTEDT